MWYEIIPSFAIICVGLAAPYYIACGMHQLVLGNRFRRNLYGPQDRLMYIRDHRLTGDVYKPAGLESVPDS